MAAEVTYLELSEETGSHKFYEVTVNSCAMTIRYGRIGDNGNTSTKEFDTPQKARTEAEKKIKSKLKKGYEHAVMGVRKKRAITRRAISSKRSSAKSAPVLWKFATGSDAFGIFVDQRGCWAGNEAGRVFALDHEGNVRNQYKLPDGVKCIVSDQDWLYAGCDDGNVYDLTGKVPQVAYEIAEDVDIYWLDIYDGILGVADEDGGLTVVNHEDESQWSATSNGTSGWMVRCDEIGVYHGHSNGVTMYDWEDGSRIWHRKTEGEVLFGWQEESAVYVGTTCDKVIQVSKKGKRGVVCDCDDTVYSCAATEDGKFIFAGDSSSSVYCFDANGKRLWKLATGCGSAYSMQYFEQRLYLVTTNGSLTCIDASEKAIEEAKEGKVPKPKSIKAPSTSGAARVGQVVTTSNTSKGVLLECYKQGSKLRVRALSEGYQKKWNVQFPKNLREEGARFVVDELRESARGGFYRAYGEIKKVR